MKCPKCGNELDEGKLLCEKCGEEIKYVPDFDIELENQLKESISTMLEDLAEEENQEKERAFEDFEADDDFKDEFRDYFPHNKNHRSDSVDINESQSSKNGWLFKLKKKEQKICFLSATPISESLKLSCRRSRIFRQRV